MEVQNLFDARLLIVTGKGGVGKSTMAATLALAGARSGRRTCLVEVEGRQTLAHLFSTQPWDFTAREFRPDLWGLAVDPEHSLREYMDRFYGAGRLGRLVMGSSTVEFATSAAPGIKDVLLLGKVYDLERQRGQDGRHDFDLVVLDAPPTGRIVNFLRAPGAATALVNVGPINRQAESMVELLTDAARTRLVAVTLLEEMPVTETLESLADLAELGVGLGPVVVNRVRLDPFDDEARAAFGDMDDDALQQVGGTVGLKLSGPARADLRRLGEEHLGRLALQDRMRAVLAAGTDLPRIELPYVAAEEFGADEVRRLAQALEAIVDPPPADDGDDDERSPGDDGGDR